MEAMKLKWIFYLLILGTSVMVKAQDAQFTQFSAIPMYLNPGFTGSTLEYRVTLLSRVQWPGASNKPYFTNAIAFDYNYKEQKSGFGGLIVSDVAGESRYRSTTASLLSSYRFSFGKGWHVKPGLNFGLGFRDINYSDLVFGNQLNLRGPNDLVITDDTYASSTDRVTFFDFSTGAVMFNQKYWFGAAVFHLNQPNITLTEGKDRLPMRWTMHAGFTFPLYKSIRTDKIIPELAPAFLYQRQGKFDQLDLGLHVYYSSFQIGVWYRGVPITQDAPLADALAFLFGFNSDQLNFAYSYDFVTTDLGAKTGGAHELSLSIQFYSDPNRRPRKGDFENINRLPPFLRQSYKKKY